MTLGCMAHAVGVRLSIPDVCNFAFVCVSLNMYVHMYLCACVCFPMDDFTHVNLCLPFAYIVTHN